MGMSNFITRSALDLTRWPGAVDQVKVLDVQDHEHDITSVRNGIGRIERRYLENRRVFQDQASTHSFYLALSYSRCCHEDFRMILQCHRTMPFEQRHCSAIIRVAVT